MNEEQRLHALAVADAIEAHADQYFQGEWGHEPCGTPACIAGWSVALQEAPDDPAMFDLGGLGGDTIPNMAGEALGLSQEEAEAMFDGCPYYWLDPDPTAAEAAAMLRHYAATGEVRMAREGVTNCGRATPSTRLGGCRGSNREAAPGQGTEGPCHFAFVRPDAAAPPSPAGGKRSASLRSGLPPPTNPAV